MDWNSILRASLIILGAVWVFSPAVHGGWISDDNLYVAENPLLNDPDRLWKAWFQLGSFVEYYPLQETAQWLQWQLWGKDPFGYHATNIALHIASALLLWRLLGKLGLRMAWLGGLIFAVHPMMVESVAWVAEFKNAISLPPFLLALGYWVDYENTKRARDYRLALAWFLVAMLCKITMAPFPIFILLYAWWKRGWIGWEDCKAAAPFLVISLALGVATIGAGGIFTHYQTAPLEKPPVDGLLSRLALVGLATSFYLSRCFLPLWPSSSYPQWVVDPPAAWQFLPWLVLLPAIYWIWRKRETWGRHALLGLGFFLLFIGPFSGLHDISYMKCEWVYDHFLYIPIIGMIGLFVAALDDVARRLPPVVRASGGVILAIAVGWLAATSHAYAAKWQNAEMLCVYNLQLNPQSWFEQNNLGYYLSQHGDNAGAVGHFEEAFRLNPKYVLAHYNLGNTLKNLNRRSEAIEQMREALRLLPDYDEAHNNLGYLLFENGQLPEAKEQFEKALKIRPDFAEAHNGLGNIYQTQGQYPEAEAEYRESIRLDPNAAITYDNLGYTLGKMGRFPESIQQFQTALAIDPQDATASAFLQNLRNLQNSASENR